MTTAFKAYFFSLNITYVECYNLYTGMLNDVLLISEDGVKVQVPVNRLKAHIDSRGIVGRFRLLVDQRNKIIAFERLR
ncbi:DUF2835 family protein [Catenovulum sediminis]|uniref:DUF2835 family protein n=1 Tax=Catenovulum sediminis TaxID=1740262 RepID=A0ABV1RI06_9ALTE|nr:DUF2835 family protein [Catenovulum sediminis]